MQSMLLTWTLLFDFGLVVLIWIVQLVIYPSFHYYPKAELMSWHSKYTAAISLIVIPLMFGQLGLHLYSVTVDPSIIRFLLLAGVVACWIITFTISVPLHGSIGDGVSLSESVTQLVRTNWFRTVLWSLVFAGGLFYSYKSLS